MLLLSNARASINGSYQKNKGGGWDFDDGIGGRMAITLKSIILEPNCLKKSFVIMLRSPLSKVFENKCCG